MNCKQKFSGRMIDEIFERVFIESKTNIENSTTKKINMYLLKDCLLNPHYINLAGKNILFLKQYSTVVDGRSYI